MTATIGKPYSKYKDYAESYHVAGTRPQDSNWQGKLAGVLGYDGSINQFAYDLASEGKDSYGRQLRKYQKNSRPALCDLTLNAPKSLSVEALVNENPIAVEAHDRGVESALKFTEQHLLFSQVKHQGQVEHAHTNRAMIGSFRQRDNREGEPHLHTHNVIFNVGWVEGKWRSLANEQVYLNKLTIGAIYQNDTAYHLHQAGYKTYWDANGQFELEGNPKRLLEETFAQRTEKLEAYLAQQGLDRTTATPEQLNVANRATRQQKVYDKDAQSQLVDWQSTATSAGIVPCQPVSRQELDRLFQVAEHPGSPQEIVIAAAERLSEKRTAFGYMELVREGCRLSSGRYLSTEIHKAVEQSKELIPVTANNPYPSYTTRTILQRESQILDWAIQGKSSYATISDSNQAVQAAEKFTLNSDQARALQHIAGSQDVVTLIQGSAGVGKTRSLSALRDLMGEHPVIGCAVGGLQAEALESESSIPSQTLSSLLCTPAKDFPQNTLIVVDEAGVVSNRQMHQLLKRVRESHCRILLVGDTKQLSAVEQGNPFRLLQTRAGLETAYISQNMRQKDEQLKAVVDLCEAQQPAAAFDLLSSQGKIREIPVEEQRIEVLVDDYLTRPNEQRRNTLIMATTHKERATLTQVIRDRLIQQGELSGPALSIEVLQKKDLDLHDLTLAAHYQVGDLVRFWRNSGQFNKSELYRVTATDPGQHTVQLIDSKGQTCTLALYRYKERSVFSPQTIELRAGEEMRFTAGRKDHKGKQLQVNGQRFRVEAVDPQSQTIEISTKGKRLTLTTEDLRHSDYRWISTVHSLQGATAQYAIFTVGQESGALLSRESWYVAASRAKLEFAVYCGDKVQLRESLQASKAQRTAIDLIHPAITEQALQAIRDYVQQQAFLAASTPEALLALTASVNQISEVTETVQEVDVASVGELEQDYQLLMQQLAEAISNYLEQEAFELAILPQLENLVIELNTLLADKVPLASKSLESKIPQQLTGSSTNYIEPAAVESQTPEALDNLTEQLTDSGSPTAFDEVIAPTPPSPSPELLAAQFQILTDQILAPEAVYQEQGLRIERRNGQIKAAISGQEIDIQKPEHLATIVYNLQALSNQFQLLSLYEEFQEAARLETSIQQKAALVVELNRGDCLRQGLSVQITENKIDIKLDRELVFQFHQGQVQRPDDLSRLENLERQLQGTIQDLQQTIEAQRQEAARIVEQARLEAARLQVERESASRSTISPPEKGHDRGFTL